ncbi:hypothetical protein QBC39DRAFT_92827 [Podospora conica]|nr:hypothetical protein QBC39DRAFT_92827 [Schizothecium conicum]
MKLLQSLALLSASLNAALALPSDISPRQSTCTSPKLRKNWSKATRAEQQSYISAVLCLAKKPSRLGLDTTLYDDFAWVHSTLTMQIHGWANFLPWHRYFVQVYEKALQDCGYTGNAMYWDWAADYRNPSKAAIFDPVTGFGGNGNVSSTAFYTQCVMDGPLTVLRPQYWNTERLPHCLTRIFTRSSPIDMLGAEYSPEVVADVSSETDYDEFRRRLEFGPHAAIHEAIGAREPRPLGYGDMNPSSSPNDPLFFLHHTNVDRLWWLWQQKSPQTRTNAYNGYRIDGSDSAPASLDDVLPMMKFAADRKVREFMDVKSAGLCYTY